MIDKGRTMIIRPDELPFTGDYYYPEDLSAISPHGPKKVKKISRRRADKELLKIKTSSGKSLKVTREHRIPVKGEGIKKAEDIKQGDVLSGAWEYGLNLRGKSIESLDLISEFADKVPGVDSGKRLCARSPFPLPEDNRRRKVQFVLRDIQSFGY